MSDAETELDDSATEFGEEDELENKDDDEEDAEKGSIGSGGFEAGDEEKKPAPKALPQETPLTADMIKGGISMLCKTGDGLEVAYVKLVVQNRELTNVFLLSTYIHLRYVDLSFNKLTSLYPLQNMRFLVSLKVKNNKLKSPQMSDFPFLQFLDLTGNPLKSTKGIKQQSLEKLILSQTQLENLDDMTSENLPNLVHLNITNNSLKKLDGLELGSMKTLYAAGNKLRNLSGLSRLTSLTRLHLRGNRISSLKGLDEDHPALEYLNVRNNSLEEVDELYHLSRMKKLTTLVIADNPISDSDAYRSVVEMPSFSDGRQGQWCRGGH